MSVSKTVLPVFVLVFSCGWLGAFTMEEGNFFYHYDLGRDYMKYRRYELATQEFEKAIKINPKEKSVYILAGRAYMAAAADNLEEDDLEKAKAALEKAEGNLLASHEIDKEYRYAHKYLGLLFLLKGNRVEKQLAKKSELERMKEWEEKKREKKRDGKLEPCDYDHAVRYLKNAVYLYAPDHEVARWLSRARKMLKEYRRNEAGEKKTRLEEDEARKNADARATKAAKLAKKAGSKAAKSAAAAEKAVAAAAKAASAAATADTAASEAVADVAKKAAASAELAAAAEQVSAKAKQAAVEAAGADVSEAKAAAEKSKAAAVEAAKAGAEAAKAAAASEKAVAKAKKASAKAVAETANADKKAKQAKQATEKAKQAAVVAEEAERHKDELRGKSEGLPELSADVKELIGSDELPDLPVLPPE